MKFLAFSGSAIVTCSAMGTGQFLVATLALTVSMMTALLAEVESSTAGQS